MLITPLTKVNKLHNAIFLAGPAPRNNELNCRWREEAIALFQQKNFNGDIITPVNPHFDQININDQINWQVECMMKSSLIFFWIPRTEEHPALTTNVEFGSWLGNKSMILGFPNNSIHNEYLKIRYEKENGRKPFNNLEEMVDWSIEYLNRNTNIYFTSDTHFSSERTLMLSKRPFTTVEEMDLNLISNWNKTVTMNDIVYHLGDFGNPKIVHMLNFKKMYYILGNYEKTDFDLNELEKDDRIIIEQDNTYLEDSETKYVYRLIHQPIFNKKPQKCDFYLYGHIHRSQFIKQNGINVGVDCNNFRPISIQDITFFRNAIQKHYDKNVFTEICKFERL